MRSIYLLLRDNTNYILGLQGHVQILDKMNIKNLKRYILALKIELTNIKNVTA